MRAKHDQAHRQALRQARRAAGQSQAELAAQAGVSRPLVAAVEAGRHTPSVTAALALARALGVPVAELFDPPDTAQPLPVVEGGTARDGAAVRVGRVGDQLVYAALPEAGVGASGFCAADGRIDSGRLSMHAGAEASGFVVAGCEPSLALLAELLPARGPARLVAVHSTSAQALAALTGGRCHAAFVHGRPRDLRPPRQPVRRFELGCWWAGLAFAPDTEVTLEAIAAGRARLARRDPGAGVQRALERALRAVSDDVRLAGPLADGHVDAARRVRLRATQAALTIEPVARAYRLAFTPLERHRVELWIAERFFDSTGARALVERLASRELRTRLEPLAGYDLSGAGTSRS